MCYKNSQQPDQLPDTAATSRSDKGSFLLRWNSFPCSCLGLLCNTNPIYIRGSGLHIQAVCIKPSILPKPLGLVSHTWKRFICIVMWIMSPK